MVCMRLRVLYAGAVCGVTLGDAVLFICGGLVVTLGEPAAGCPGV